MTRKNKDFTVTVINSRLEKDHYVVHCFAYRRSDGQNVCIKIFNVTTEDEARDLRTDFFSSFGFDIAHKTKPKLKIKDH